MPVDACVVRAGDSLPWRRFHGGLQFVIVALTGTVFLGLALFHFRNVSPEVMSKNPKLTRPLSTLVEF
jgi:hypothetical protein